MTGINHNRRAFLVTVGAVPVVGAGCIGDDADDESTDDGEVGDGTSDDQTADDQGQDHFDEAIGELVTTAERLQDVADDDDEELSASEIEQLESQVNDAEALLDEAEADATDDLQPKISAARDVILIQRELLTFETHLVEFGNSIDTIPEMTDDLEFDEADSELDNALALVENIRAAVSDIKDILEEADTGALEEETLAYNEDIWEYVPADNRNEIDLLEENIAGMRNFIQGMASTFSGIGTYEVGSYDQAETYFEDAITDMENAITVFQGLEDDPDTPDEERSEFIELRTQLEEWVTGLEYLKESAEVAQMGNISEANEIWEQGMDIFEEMN